MSRVRQRSSGSNSWLYFGTRFGLKIDLFLEPKPGVPPTPTHLAEVILKMKADKVHVIIVDPYLDRRTAEKVAERTEERLDEISRQRYEWTSPRDWRRPMMLWAQKVMVFLNVRPQWKYIQGYGQHMRRWLK